MHINEIKKQIIFICTGNTCRSPMAQAIANGIHGDKVHAESAGIETADGMKATKEAIRVMKERGYDIRNHNSRSIDLLDLNEYDIIIAMTQEIADYLKNGRKINDDRLLILNVTDPYGKGLEEYQRCADQLTMKIQELCNSPIFKRVVKPI